MNRLPRLRHAFAAATAGWLLAAAFTAPAAAEHPESAPTPFYNSVEGEDGCALFETSGEASWPAVHPPATAHVAVSGMAAISDSSDGLPCLPVIPFDRQIEFTGHVNDWPAVEHVVPMPYGSPDFEYSFTLEAPGGSAIEYVTMQLCQERRPDGSDWTGRCGEKVLIERGGGGPTVPEDPYCEFTAVITNDWGSGYMVQVTITAIEPISDWQSVVLFPGGQTLTQIWNAEASQSGSQVQITPASWNGQIPGSGSASFGFIVSGGSQPPPQIAVWADGHLCVEL